MTGRPPNNLTSALAMGRAAHLRPIHDLRPRPHEGECQARRTAA